MFKLNLGSLPPKSTTPSNSEPSSSASTPVDEQQQQAPITSRLDSSSTDTILRLNMSSLSQLRNGKLTDQHDQNNNDNDPIDDDEQHEESGDNEDEIRTTLMPKLQLNLSSMKLSNASIAAAASNATTTAMVDEETLSNSNNNNSDNNQVKTNNKRIVTVDLIVPQFCKCVVESSDSTNEYNQVKQHIENKWLKTQQRSNEQNQNCNTTTTTNDNDDDDDKKSIKPNISLYKIQSIDANNNSSSLDENLACSLTLPIIMDTTNGDTSDLTPQQLSIFTVSSLNELIAQNQSLTIKYQKAMSALIEYSTQNQSLKQELSQNKKQIEELNRTRLEMRTLVDSLMHQHQLLAQSMLSTSAASHHQHPTASEPTVKTIPVPQPSKKNRKKKRTIKRKEQQKAAQQQQQQPQQQSSQNKNKK